MTVIRQYREERKRPLLFLRVEALWHVESKLL